MKTKSENGSGNCVWLLEEELYRPPSINDKNKAGKVKMAILNTTTAGLLAVSMLSGCSDQKIPHISPTPQIRLVATPQSNAFGFPLVAGLLFTIEHKVHFLSAGSQYGAFEFLVAQKLLYPAAFVLSPGLHSQTL